MSDFLEHLQEPIGFFIYDYSTGGGVERVTANLMGQFVAKGFSDLVLISFPPENAEPVMHYPENVRIKIITKKNLKTDLVQVLQSEKITRMIYQADNMGIALRVLAAGREAKTKTFGQYHGSPFAYLKKYADTEHKNLDKKAVAAIQYSFKLNKLKKVIEQSVDGLFCVSEGSKNELKSLFPSEKLQENIFVIRNPVLLNEKQSADKENVVTMVSRLERKHKNAFLIVKGWSLIHQLHSDWTLKILGDGSLMTKMQVYCKTKGIKNVEFLGFVKNVNDELAKSRISVNVSNCEGFSMSVAEAIVQGNAIAATGSDGGASDMLIHNETALISAKNDADGLAKNISRLITDAELRDKLMKNAQNRLEDIASENSFEQWIKVLFKK